MDGWCGTVDPRNIMVLFILPFFMLYLLGNFIYCKLIGKEFLETERKELEEARNRPPIVLK